MCLAPPPEHAEDRLDLSYCRDGADPAGGVTNERIEAAGDHHATQLYWLISSAACRSRGAPTAGCETIST